MDLVISVQYQVIKESVYDAFYKLTDSSSQIRSYGAWMVMTWGEGLRASLTRTNL